MAVAAAIRSTRSQSLKFWIETPAQPPRVQLRTTESWVPMLAKMEFSNSTYTHWVSVVMQPLSYDSRYVNPLHL